MLTRIATAALSATLLVAAGAIAFSPAQADFEVKKAPVTIVEKNQHWPLKGYITMAPCKRTACQEV